MWSRRFLIVLLAALLCFLITGVACAERQGDFEYSVLSDGSVSIDRYRGAAPSVSIPSRIAGRSVTRIGDSAFIYNASLESVVIPEGVLSIGASAFSHCSALRDVRLSGTVTRIGKLAFSWCSAMTAITIPGNVKSIEEAAFAGSQSLRDVALEEGVASIGENAFRECDIRSITLPDSLTAIGSNPFVNCKQLSEIVVSPGHPSLRLQDGMLLSTRDQRLICFLQLNLAQRFEADGVRMAHWQLAIPDGVRVIDPYALMNCYYMTDVSIPGSVTDIGEGAFYNCSGLGSVTIPNGIKVIRQNTFAGCMMLESVDIPESVVTIEAKAFDGCGALHAISLPQSITSMDGNPFTGCANLRSINLAPEHPCLVLRDGVLFSEQGRRLVCYPLTLRQSSYTIPQGTRVIGKYAFMNSQPESIVIPDSVTDIEPNAFFGCNSLRSISIPSSVRTVRQCAFNLCSALESVELCEGVAELETQAFVNCRALESVDVAQSVTRFDEHSFYNTPSIVLTVRRDSAAEAFAVKSGYLYVYPAKGKFTYRVVSGSSIPSVEITRYAGDEKEVEIPEKLSGFQVTGIAQDAFAYCASVRSVIIPDSVQHLEGNPFIGCLNLREIRVSPGHPTLGTDGRSLYQKTGTLLCYFAGKTDSAYEIPDFIRHIGAGAFASCPSLQSVTIPGSVLSIERRAFLWCSALEHITIPDGVRTIGKEAFFGIESLRDVILPSSVSSIGNEAFNNSPNVTLIVPKGSYAERYAKKRRLDYRYPDAQEPSIP